MKKIKVALTPKLKGAGKLEYCIAKDDSELYLAITENWINTETKGDFSDEFIPVTKILKFLDNQKDQSINSKSLNCLFEIKSTCNAGFLAAVFRNEGLLKAAGNNHIIQRNYLGKWEKENLALDVGISTTKI